MNLPEGFVLENAPQTAPQAQQQAPSLPAGFVLENQPQNVGPIAQFNEMWGNTPRTPVAASNNRASPLDAEVGNVLAREAQSADPTQARKARVEQNIRGMEDRSINPAADVFMQGLTYGLSDELGAALQTLRGSGNYSELLDAERERLSRIKKDSPVLSTVTEIAGAVANPISRVVWAAQAPTRAARFARGAVEGAGLSGLYAFNQGEGGFENRMSNVPSAMLVGGLTGGAANALMPAVKGAVSQTPGSLVQEAAERQNIALPRAVTSDSRSTQQLGKIATNVPIAGQPLRTASQTAIDQIDNQTSNIASAYGTNANAATAGATLRSGVEEYIGPTTAGKVTKAYDAVDNIVNPNTLTPLQNTAAKVQEIVTRRGNAALPAESPAVQQVLDAVQRQQGLSYEGIKTLRTSVGEMMKSSNLPANISQGELKALYGSLTQDLQGAVKNAGGDKALHSWKRANQLNAAVMNRRESLNRLLNVKSDEQLFERVLKAAYNKGGDQKLLAQARKALPADEWNEVAAGVINRLGRDAEGALTPDRFVKAYGDLSPAGKAMLFRSTGQSGLANALDDVATVMSRFKSLNQYANPSGTAQSGIAGAAYFGLFADPITTLTSVASAAVISKLLSRPQSAQSIAKWSNAYYNAVAKPTRATLENFNRASRTFADDVGRQLNAPQHAEALFRQLQGTVRAPAEDQRGQ